MKSLRGICQLLLLCAINLAYVSANDTLVIAQSLVSDSTFVRIDSSEINTFHSLADYFLHNEPGYTNYGIGAPGLISSLGLGPKRTAISWNGVVINRSGGGFYDASLIVPENFTEVTVDYGAQSAYVGSNAIGGVINVISSPECSLKKQFYVKGNTATNFSTGGYANFKVGKSLGRISLNYRNQTNSFDGIQAQFMGAQKGISGLVEMHHPINDKNTLGISLWYTKSNRTVPSYYSKIDSSFVNDHDLSAYNTQLFWQYKSKKFNTRASVTYLNLDDKYEESFVYDDRIEDRLIAQNKARLKLGMRSNLLSTLSFTQSELIETGDGDGALSTLTGFFGSFSYVYDGEFDIKITAGLDALNLRYTVFVPAIEIGRISNKIRAVGYLQRIFNRPTIEEDLLYLIQQKQSLRPETGWELGFDLGYHLDHFNIGIKVFQRSLINRIEILNMGQEPTINIGEQQDNIGVDYRLSYQSKFRPNKIGFQVAVRGQFINTDSENFVTDYLAPQHSYHFRSGIIYNSLGLGLSVQNRRAVNLEYNVIRESPGYEMMGFYLRKNWGQNQRISTDLSYESPSLLSSENYEYPIPNHFVRLRLGYSF